MNYKACSPKSSPVFSVSVAVVKGVMCLENHGFAFPFYSVKLTRQFS